MIDQENNYYYFDLSDSLNENIYFPFYSYNSNNKKILIYLNGKTVSSKILKTYLTSAYNKLYIGKVCAGSSCDYYLNGTIDEVRIYNRALSDEEIKQCFLGNCPNDDSLVLYLDFDDCTAKDKSGKGNDGTIHGNVQCVDEGILSGVQLYYPRNCFNKGAVWELYYGNPNEGGVLLAQDVVDRKWSSS